jgi:WD40 repeat protein
VSNDRLITGLCCTLAVRAHVWAVPEGRPAGVLDFGAPSDWVVRGNSVLTDTPSGGPPEAPAEVRLRRWPLPGESATELGTVDWKPLGASARYFSPDGASWLYAKASTLYARALPLAAGAADRPVGSQSTRIVEISPDRARADALLTSDAAAELRLAGALRRWTLVAGEKARVEDVPRPTTAAHPVEPDASDRWLVDGTMTDNRVLVWKRGAWPAARPLELRRSGTWTVTAWTTHPSGDRLVASTAGATNLTFWPLGKPYPTIVDGYAHSVRPLAFSPDSRWLATSWEGRLLRLWPISPDTSTPPLPLGVSEANQWWGFAFDPGGRHLFAVGNWGRTWIVPLSGEPARRLHGFPEDTVLQAAGISPSGRYVATAVGWGRAEKMLRVFDLETGDVRVFDLPQPKAPGGSSKPAWAGFEGGILSLGFAGESTLYTSGHGGVRRWDLTSGKQETVIEIPPDQTADMRIQPEKGLAVTLQGHLGRPDECAPVVAHDLATRSSWPLPAFGSCVQWFDLDASGGVLATGDKDGIVRVGRLSASEPHLLVGHKGVIDRVAISPDLRLVASTGGDNTLRVWPMPDLDKPPLHTLPRAELVAKLKSLTNLRAVRDPKSATDWTIETGPFPGWKNVPTW